jgi:O-antigen/teichoic acid export membrane protein
MVDPDQRSRRTTILENLAFGYVAIIITIIQGILLVPLYLRVIPVDLYGAWLATGNILAWVELADPGVSSVLQQRVAFASGRGDARALGSLIGTGIALSAIFAVVPLTCLPLAGRVGGWVNLTGNLRDELARSFSLGIVAVSFSLASQGLNSVNVGIQRVRAAGMVSTAALIAGLVVTVVGLLQGLGLASLPLGSLTRSVVMVVANGALIVAWVRREGIPLHPSWDETKALLGVTAYSFVSRIGVSVLTRADAFLSARFLTPASTVTLSLTGRAVDVMRLATDRLGMAAMPVVANLAGERGVVNARVGVRAVTRWVAAVAAVVAGTAVAWNGHFVRLWVGPQHFGGDGLTVLLAAYAGSASIMSALGQVLFAVGRIRAVALLSLGEAIGRLLAMWFWVPLVALKGFPAAALSAALLVSGSLVPAVMARSFGAAALKEYAALIRDWALVAGFVLAGSAIRWFVPVGSVQSWPALLLATGGTALGFAGIVGVIDPSVRGEFAQRVRATLARGRPAGSDE